MNKLVAAAQQVQAVLETADLRFCFIGGFAAQRHAEPRVTRDVDLSILTGLGNETHVIDVMLALSRRDGRTRARLPNATEFSC